ncbi:MAG: hypothetical protein KKD44_16890 [Proteobacteria bacterium]|nr:hypothetical protein [Pseudomonadota bacterium]
MNDTEKNLARYLEMEGILNDFFRVFNFCFDQCIKPEIEKNGNQPVAACCKNKYYMLYDLDHPAFDRLKQEREIRYGKPEDHHWPDPVSPCEYHSPVTGCVLATHKSPICLAFMCRESIDFLRKTYSIFAYDYLGVNYALEWILTGDFSHSQFNEFKDSIRDMIKKVESNPCPVKACDNRA